MQQENEADVDSDNSPLQVFSRKLENMRQFVAHCNKEYLDYVGYIEEIERKEKENIMKMLNLQRMFFLASQNNVNRGYCTCPSDTTGEVSNYLHLSKTYETNSSVGPNHE